MGCLQSDSELIRDNYREGGEAEDYGISTEGGYWLFVFGYLKEDRDLEACPDPITNNQ
jgi:hypothetical protein